MAASLLNGVRILDFSQYVPGPYATLMLSDLGADVVKIEPPAGDPMRGFGALGGEDSPFYAVMNGGKRLIRLDLKTTEGLQAALTLIAGADVLLESFRPGVLDRLGLGPKVLSDINPRLILCSISSYGQNGPLAGKGAHDLNCMALGGGLAVSGTPASPVITMPPVADYASALQGALTIAAALFAREQTGKGCSIDISMSDTVLAWQSWLITDAIRGGPIARRGEGEGSGGVASYNIYETRDGRFISLAADEDKFWERFCRAVGRDDWVQRKSEPVPQHALVDEVRQTVRAKTLAEWNTVLGDIDCCYQPVVNPVELPHHPQVLARQMIAPANPATGAVEVLYPAWIDGKPPSPRPSCQELEASTVQQSWAEGGANRRTGGC